MPRKRSRSSACKKKKKCRRRRRKSRVGHKISKLVREGYPHKQAIAIALSMDQAGRLGPLGGYRRVKKSRSRSRRRSRSRSRRAAFIKFKPVFEPSWYKKRKCRI